MTSIGFDPYYEGEDDERDLQADWAYFHDGDHNYEPEEGAEEADEDDPED